MGESPTREGPGYATASETLMIYSIIVYSMHKSCSILCNLIHSIHAVATFDTKARLGWQSAETKRTNAVLRIEFALRYQSPFIRLYFHDFRCFDFVRERS